MKERVLQTEVAFQLQLLNEKDRQPGEPLFDAAKYPMVVINFGGLLATYVSDPEVVQEMYTGKYSKILEKTDVASKVFEPFFNDFMAFMPANQRWKDQRKACGHMFFKQKLHIMADVFKEHLNIECDKWMAEIEQKGEARIDISSAFERIFAHTINHICFGEDLNDDKFMFSYLDL